MIIKRKSKLFSLPSSPASFQGSQGGPQQPGSSQPENPMTSKDLQLQIENMRLQRQIMLNNRMKQRMQVEERNDRMKNLVQIQKMEAEKDQTDKMNQVRVQKAMNISNLNPADRNWNLVKSKSKPVTPVPMKD